MAAWIVAAFPLGGWTLGFTRDSVARALTREDFNRLALTCMFDPPDFADRWGLSLNDEPKG